MAPADVWSELLDRARNRTADHAALEALSLVECKQGVMALRLVDPGARALVRGRLAWIEGQASSLMGAKVTLDVQGLDDQRSERSDDDLAAQHRAMEDPVVRKAVELFDARVAGVRTVKDDQAGGH